MKNIMLLVSKVHSVDLISENSPENLIRKLCCNSSERKGHEVMNENNIKNLRRKLSSVI